MKRLPLIFLLALIASGCVRSIPNPSGTAPVSGGSPASMPPALSAPAESLTDEPIHLETAVPTQIPGPTPAWSGTADPRFEKTSILEVGYMDVGILIAVLDLKASVEGDYQAVVSGEIFSCTRLEKYPERLYCSGPAPAPDSKQTITLYPIEGGEAVWQGEVTVPEMESS